MRGKHHTALCDAEKQANQENNEKKEGRTFLVDQEKSVLLQTANAYVSNTVDDKHFAAKILMDSCSQQTYITSKIVQELRLQPIREVTVGIKTFNNSEASVQKLKEYSIILKSLINDRKISVNALAVPSISSSLSDQCITTVIKKNPDIAKLKLADNGHSSTKEIDVLVGADIYWQLFSGEIKQINDGLVLLKSMFGWVLNGPVFSKEKNQSVNFVSSSVLKISTTYQDECLTNQVQKFWDFDTIGIKEREISKYEQVIEDIEFVNGRYKMKLPFKENHAVIPDYYDLCKNRLSRLYNRLSQDRNLLEDYDKIIREQLKYGIVEEVDSPGTFGNVSYLPHKEVLRNDKSSTKVRVVFDASAKTKKNVSLNEILYKGPCLSPKLYDLLIKFRLYPVALVADIGKAYLQILIDEKDRDFMRFLWYDNIFASNPNIIKLRFCRVIFGATCSQFLLNAVLHHHALKFENTDPDLSRIIKSHFYVDDLSTGVDSTEQGINLYMKIKLSFSDVGFNVRKWRSNDKVLLDSIYENEKKVNNNTFCYKKLKCSRVLGILWDEEKDKFILGVDDKFKNANDIIPTKRNILSIICGVYDPVGYLQPIIIKLKLIFQEICMLNISWEEKISGDLLKKWERISIDLRDSTKIQINRCYFVYRFDDPVVKSILHGFSDASLVAYGAWVYLKSITQSGNVHLALVSSKSRVVPNKKKFTIPRLELLGNFILSKLIKAIYNAFMEEIPIDSYYCWTGSMVSLSWVKSINKEYKVFVQNRVVAIRENVAADFWFYCKSSDNPADIITRFNENNNLCDNSLWFDGPSFLSNLEENSLIHNNECIYNGDSLGEELKFTRDLCNTSNCLLITFDKEKENDAVRNLDQIFDINRYNSLTKLIHITSYVYRFIHNLKNIKRKNELNLSRFITQEEIRHARNEWIKFNQSLIKKDENQKERCTNLNLFVDTNGFLRCKGRLSGANLPYEAKEPYYLFRSHKLVDLIILDCHSKLKHNGQRQTLAEFRSSFWIVRAKSLVRKLLHNCVICRKFNGRPYNYPKYSALPDSRVQGNVPFASTGVDLFGPIFVKNVYLKDAPDHTYKSYGVIYTCGTSRGIVLDLLKDGSSNQFMNSVVRFISRRGCPRSVLSDNGTIFRSDMVQQYAAEHNIKWLFNIQDAPWFGGFWERLIKCVKSCLKKTLGKSRLTFYELQTCIFEIEMILNSRPLHSLFDDEFEDVLTPNHLLFGRKLNLSNENEHIVNPVNTSRRFVYLNSVIEHFWKRWRYDYLLSLREFHRPMKSNSNAYPNVDDIVLVYEEKQPRQHWKLARVKELILSKDNQVRAAKVIVGKSKNILNRPVNRLYPIELNKDNVPEIMKIDDVDENSNLTQIKNRPKRNHVKFGLIITVEIQRGVYKI